MCMTRVHKCVCACACNLLVQLTSSSLNEIALIARKPTLLAASTSAESR
jgi:hypothetical protein